MCSSIEGDCYHVCCTKCHSDLSAPQGVNLGAGGSLSYWHNTVKWLALVLCKVVPKMYGTHGLLYKNLKFKFRWEMPIKHKVFHLLQTLIGISQICDDDPYTPHCHLFRDKKIIEFRNVNCSDDVISNFSTAPYQPYRICALSPSLLLYVDVSQSQYKVHWLDCNSRNVKTGKNCCRNWPGLSFYWYVLCVSRGQALADYNSRCKWHLLP